MTNLGRPAGPDQLRHRSAVAAQVVAPFAGIYGLGEAGGDLGPPRDALLAGQQAGDPAQRCAGGELGTRSEVRAAMASQDRAVTGNECSLAAHAEPPSVVRTADELGGASSRLRPVRSRPRCRA